MNNCLITFRSVTPAQRGEGVLRRAGMDCALQRTPRWMEEQGCGYSLRLRQVDGARAAALLRRNGISFRKVYLQGENFLEELSV
ncbi:MAG: DUF3343 domain-containing protein [Oscillospiraceae bacterium]|nr:DUF3343 domain-containing protein [Oscillospiraceae bacterium]